MRNVRKTVSFRALFVVRNWEITTFKPARSLDSWACESGIRRENETASSPNNFLFWTNISCKNEKFADAFSINYACKQILVSQKISNFIPIRLLHFPSQAQQLEQQQQQFVFLYLLPRIMDPWVGWLADELFVDNYELAFCHRLDSTRLGSSNRMTNRISGNERVWRTCFRASDKKSPQNRAIFIIPLLLGLVPLLVVASTELTKFQAESKPTQLACLNLFIINYLHFI